MKTVAKHSGMKAAMMVTLAVVLVLIAFGGTALAGWDDLTPNILDGYGILEEDVADVSTGYGPTVWGPYDPMLRAYFAKIAVEAFHVPEAGSTTPTFSDVPPTDTFYECIEDAAAGDLIEGYQDGTFKPERTITRQQAAAIIARYLAQQEGVDLATHYASAQMPGGLGAFSDAGLVSESLRAEVAYAVEQGVLKGSGGRLLPNDAVSRIQGVAMLIRAANACNELTEPFMIVAVPDTQIYAEEGELGFEKQIEWILANAASNNIVFVTHLGDVVDNGTDDEQWANAMAALDPLLKQDQLPFSIVRGNHDDPDYFLSNLPVSLMESKPWFVAASPSGLCQAQRFEVEDMWFLHVGFQKDPTTDELQWANELLDRPSLQGMPVIVSTHDYIDGSGQSRTGKMMWDGFVKNNPMVFMVLNGHTHTEYAVVNHGAANRPVFQMLSDYQDREFGGNGLMRLITIDPVNDTIDVKTFSPYYQTENDDDTISVDTDYFETDADSEFVYSVNVNERLAFNTTFDFGPEPPAPPLPELNDIPADIHYTQIFQNRRPLVGATAPYAGTVDVQINENNANLNYGGEATLTTDMDDNGSRVHAFLRFDDIIGNGPGQIPAGSTIVSAKLVFTCTSSTTGLVKMHRMLVPWGETSTWMDFTPVDATGQPTWASYIYFDTEDNEDVTLDSVMVGGGVQADGVEAMSATDAVFNCVKPIPMPFIIQPPVADEERIIECDLTAAVQAWVNGQTNYGWFFEPTSGNGWDFETAEGKQPPALVVEVAGYPPVQ